MQSVKRTIAMLCAAALLFGAGASTAQQPPGRPGGKPAPGAPGKPPPKRPPPGAPAAPPEGHAHGPAHAPPGMSPADRAEAAKARRDAARARQEGHSETGPDHPQRAGLHGRHGPRRARPAVPPAKIEARRGFLEARHARWQKDHAARVQARRDEIRKKWGDAVKHDRVQAELKLHAWRRARLNAIKEIATEEGDAAVVARADQLITKEDARHERRMTLLKNNPDADDDAKTAEPAVPPAPSAEK